MKADYTIDTVKLLAAYNYSPNFFGRSGTGNYVEGGVDVTLPSHSPPPPGWLPVDPAQPALRHARLPLVLHRRLAGDLCRLHRHGGLVRHQYRQEGMRPGRRPRHGGQRVCDGRVLFTLSRIF